MSITEIILEYLSQNRRITVGGLGTFLTKRGTSTVVFSEFVNEDDGVLQGELVSRGLKELEAMAVIDRYVFDLKYALTTEGRLEYVLPGLGRMSMFGGALSFEHDPEAKAVESTATIVIPDPKVVEPVVAAAAPIEVVADKSVEEPIAESDNLFDSFADYAGEGRTLNAKESFDKWWIIIPIVAVIFVLVAIFYWLAVEWMYGNIELPGFLDSIMRSLFMNESGVPEA